ncbi:CPBP family intramembrane metalloprotease [Clostridium tyrobutyricum]|uniref:CAAX amino terminal protease family family n=1 Tax=Clostridium tyrobutyricum DIVETGP TaxID=1408889 RepID=W6N991_CLOTY|nr:CPBP family intramembrane glutamic endopeptidase [Clostridium tyrobutyricum]AND83634.1 abortive infection protein [Clostridium tyrobutyricum]ANP68407.1 abortive phage infection protein [Clostridium tyrobutyricum]MBV4430987.1 CPBP family intramembrane metalloprotease [Clostridium tyrobutyricum]MBV4435609.1 CPBP family intramembrane metalloprotease [Clostridium tyrobutyricum]MBV4439832.1 CPBP family intramembrane metalloprotease [Clostridium tyrobutyricum]
MTDKKIIVQFTMLTFCIAYLVSGALIALGKFGYSVHNWVHSLQQFGMNIPFAIYILSPAIASYIVLGKNDKIADFKEWLKTVFYAKNTISLYLYVVAGLALYFLIHIAVSGHAVMGLPFYTFFFSLPGNLIIGGLEEAGWMYILQPGLNKKYGFILSSIFTGIIWTAWHIPLFFIPGTNHGEGLINFWMFAVQLIAFRFFNGAIYKISGKGRVFMCVLFHTMFNAASPIFGTMTVTWAGTIAANAAIVLVSIVTIVIYGKKSRRIV